MSNLLNNSVMNAESIRLFREAKNLTQAQLAELLGVSPTAVTTWEKGQEPAGPALKLLRFLINNEHPFASPENSGASWEMPLNLSEWEALEVRRIRSGFASVRDYLIWRVRKDLAEHKNDADVVRTISEPAAYKVGKAPKKQK
jgi:transcriptional regulator with XRE-family HTH domain